MFKKTLMAAVAALTLAGGTIATTQTANAGGIYFGFGPGYHHSYHGYGHGYGWGGGWGGGYYGGCYWKSFKVWTPYGPEWVQKKVCY